jgi:hypothetical protein
LKFKYTRYSQNVLRPVIRVKVRHRDRALFYDVLVDSGADINVFNEELAEALGIDLTSGVPAEVAGATGEPVSVYVHPVELTVGDRSFTAQVAFIPTPNPFGLAGQQGFFDQFKVTFNFREEEIDLTDPRSDAAA